MNISDALKSIIRSHEDDRLYPLTTVFGEALDPEHVLPEYPRPQLVRDSYINLNGKWDYCITGSSQFPTNFQGEILVPFSPEASLSGVGRQLKPEEYLWYRRTIPVDTKALAAGMRLILHFGAVDCITKVFLNNQEVMIHEGGYLPFEADITPYLQNESNILLVQVQDFTEQKSLSRGKQSLKRGGIFYTAQSGIWQTVWMEWVAPCHIQRLQVQTDFDKRKVSITLMLSSCCQKQVTQTTSQITVSAVAADDTQTVPPHAIPASAVTADDTQTLPLCVAALYAGKELCKQTITVPVPEQTSLTKGNDRLTPVTLSFTLSEEDFHPWSPETPSLYDLQISFGADRVASYFAMRLFNIEYHKPEEADAPVPVFCLNHKPCFLMGALDQGYWPEGLYTAPSDEALIYDITTLKSLGFNMLRKHIKVESARWYYHCDRLGMIVCQDMVNGGSSYKMPVINFFPTLFPSLTPMLKDSHYGLFSREDKAARDHWEKECMETIDALSFFPCIAIWGPFNEGWGQFDSVRITDMIRTKDNSRLIDSASGWFDQGCGDFISEHNYFRPLRVNVKKWNHRALFLSEYGGYACYVKGHSSVDRIYGYKRYDTIEEFKSAYHDLIKNSLLPLQKQGLSGAVYTQLSDIEEEVNGILTYDRKVNKLAD